MAEWSIASVLKADSLQFNDKGSNPFSSFFSICSKYMKNIHNQFTHADTFFDLDLIDEIYNSQKKTFGKNFWTQISTKWRVPYDSKKTSSPHYSSGIYDPTLKECLVLITPSYVKRFPYNPSLKDSFVTFLHQLKNKALTKRTPFTKDILIVFPSLSFIPPEQQLPILYNLSQEYGNDFSFSFKAYDESLNPKNYKFRKITFPLSKERKIHILGLFEFFSCTNFASLSYSLYAYSLTTKLNQINTLTPKVSTLSFLLKLRTFVKYFTKETNTNLKLKDILLYTNLFEYTLHLWKSLTHKSHNLWAFSHIPSYLIMQKISLSGLLIVNSLGSAPWLSPYTKCESIPQLEESWSQGPFYHYDVNSLYPYIMANYSLPTGRPIIHSFNKTYENPKDFLKGDFENFFGFLQIHIVIKELSPHCKDDYFKHPTLPYQIQTHPNEVRTIFPTGKFYGIYFSPEIEHLINTGCVESLTLYRTFEYQRATVFKDLMNFLYPLRNPEKSPYSHNIIKFLMNSFYGNLSINPFKLTKVTIHQNNEAFPKTKNDYRPPNLYPNYHLTRSKKFPQYGFNKKLFKFMKENGTPKNHEDFTQFAITQLPHIAAAITSYGRLILAKLIYTHKIPIILCNTDSLITNKELPMKLICPKTMGKLKLVNTYENIYVKTLNQYIVENAKKERFAIGNFSHYETELMKDSDKFLHTELEQIFTKESAYIEKTLFRTSIFNKNKIPLNWTFPLKI